MLKSSQPPKVKYYINTGFKIYNPFFDSNRDVIIRIDDRIGKIKPDPATSEFYTWRQGYSFHWNTPGSCHAFLVLIQRNYDGIFQVKIIKYILHGPLLRFKADGITGNGNARHFSQVSGAIAANDNAPDIDITLISNKSIRTIGQLQCIADKLQAFLFNQHNLFFEPVDADMRGIRVEWIAMSGNHPGTEVGGGIGN